LGGTPSAAVDVAQTSDALGSIAANAAPVNPGPSTAQAAADAAPRTEPADPWAAILEAGAALLQELVTARTAGASTSAAARVTIERDPVTGQASVRLPLPDAAVMQRLAKAFAPWLQ
jgi:hypothetical protein